MNAELLNEFLGLEINSGTWAIFVRLQVLHWQLTSGDRCDREISGILKIDSIYLINVFKKGAAFPNTFSYKVEGF